MKPTVVFLGGNGHCAARLEPAQAALAAQGAPFHLVEVPYPGFENRPRAADWSAFLDAVSERIHREAAQSGSITLYGTGIGGLLALCLRARGELRDTPMILQGAVLWGLERRLMPRVMRFTPLQRLLPLLFASPRFQARFVRKYFTHPPEESLRRAFFEGYAQCAALPDFFRWMTPQLLRTLERDFLACPEALDHLQVWWGGNDQVVSLQELRWTEEALRTSFAVRLFPEWGHYPMLDAPERWIETLATYVEERRLEPSREEVAPQ